MGTVIGLNQKGDIMKGLYQSVRELWKKPRKNLGKKFVTQRLVEWRKQPAVLRIDRPTRIDRARALGYKAKQGYVVVRARVKKGTTKRPAAHRRGRRPKRYGLNQLPVKVGKQFIAETRVSRKFPNLEVLNSYWVGADGKQEWFEIILVDPEHPVIKNDKKINWICEPQHKRRVFRGLTRKHARNTNSKK